MYSTIGRDQRDDRDNQNEPLMREHPAQAAFVRIEKSCEIFFGPLIKRALVFSVLLRFRTNNFAHIIGVNVSETNAETPTATLNVIANSRNNRPTIPVMNSRGMKTAMSDILNEIS